MNQRTITPRSWQVAWLAGSISILSLTTIQVKAQSLERQLVACTGSTASSASFLIDFSVGDLVVSTANTSSFVLTQGYQQTTDLITTVTMDTEVFIDLIAFPNPTRDAVTLLWSSTPEVPYSVSVFNLMGEMVRSERALSSSMHALDFTELAAGMYSLHVLVEGRSPIVLRVQKVG